MLVYSGLCALLAARFDLTRDCLKAANEPGTHRSLSRLPLSSVSLFSSLCVSSSGSLRSPSPPEVTLGQGLSKGRNSKGELNWYSGAVLLTRRQTKDGCVSHLRSVTWVLVIR